MKELYTSPEMKLLCLAPAERLANDLINFDDLLNVNFSSPIGGVSGYTEDDVQVTIPRS